MDFAHDIRRSFRAQPLAPLWQRGFPCHRPWPIRREPVEGKGCLPVRDPTQTGEGFCVRGGSGRGRYWIIEEPPGLTFLRANYPSSYVSQTYYKFLRCVIFWPEWMLSQVLKVTLHGSITTQILLTVCTVCSHQYQNPNLNFFNFPTCIEKILCP
jgi:hypothetical protein